VQLSVDDVTESEDKAVDTKPRMDPMEEAAAAHRHKDVTKEKIETSQGTASTEMRPQTDAPNRRPKHLKGQDHLATHNRSGKKELPNRLGSKQ
jgi:hypothetical protein